MSLLKSRFIEMFGDVINNKKTWPTKRWSDVLNIVNGKNQKKVECENGIYPICGSGGEIGKTNEYLTKENSVIIGRKGNINNPILMKTKFWNVDTAFGLEPNNKEINVEYLYKFCELFDFQRLNKTVTIPSLTKSDLLKIEIPVPPMKLQEEYRNFLAQVDKSKFLLQQILEKFELLKKSRFIEMFIEKRYPTASLDELSICGGEYGAQSSAIEYHPNRPRYVRITDINEDGSLNNDYASSANIKDDEQYRLKYGDFLFARMGATVGKTYAYTFGDQIYAGYLIRYRLNLEKILPEYLFAFTRLNCYWKWVSINQNGAAQPGINAKKYGSLYVPVPPIEEQKKFIELSQQIDKSKLIIQNALEDLVGKV